MIKEKTWILLLLIFFVSFLFVLESAYAATSSLVFSNDTVTSSDAIAVRIVPNPNHYSINQWYARQGFQGSPQALTVDGYEAIRDGRTVYVNAANVNLTSSPKTIYTNIYLISYNQNPSPNTVDILGQIISHWKFNDNLTSSTNSTANCSISTLSCLSDTDCSSCIPVLPAASFFG